MWLAHCLSILLFPAGSQPSLYTDPFPHPSSLTLRLSALLLGFLSLSVTGAWTNAQHSHCISSSSYILFMSKPSVPPHKGIRALCLHNAKTHKNNLFCEKGVSAGREEKGLEGCRQASTTLPVLPDWTPLGKTNLHGQNSEQRGVSSLLCHYRHRTRSKGECNLCFIQTAGNLGSQSRHYQAFSCRSGQVLSPPVMVIVTPPCVCSRRQTVQPTGLHSFSAFGWWVGLPLMQATCWQREQIPSHNIKCKRVPVMWDTHWTSKMAHWVGVQSMDPQRKSWSLTPAGMLYVHGGCMLEHVHGGQELAFPSTVWVPGVELRFIKLGGGCFST